MTGTFQNFKSSCGAKAGRLRDRVAEMYVPIERALQRITRKSTTRCRNRPRGLLERCLAERSRAVLWRSIATPNNELLRFVSIARKYGLEPLVLEYQADVFHPDNPCKSALCTVETVSRHHAEQHSFSHKLTICDTAMASGRKLSSIRTYWGTSIVTFHHSLFDQSVGAMGVEHLDASEWLTHHGPHPSDYYIHLMKLFLGRSILFESYLTDTAERMFTSSVVIPAFKRTLRECGEPPLICQLDPPEEEGSRYWLKYPTEMWPVITRIIPRRFHYNDLSP